MKTPLHCDVSVSCYYPKNAKTTIFSTLINDSVTDTRMHEHTWIIDISFMLATST